MDIVHNCDRCIDIPLLQTVFAVTISQSSAYRFRRAEYFLPPDGTFGVQKADGTWSGVVGMVATDQVDFGIALFSYAQERMNFVNYLSPILNLK
jgi:hypothetical protein